MILILLLCWIFPVAAGCQAPTPYSHGISSPWRLQLILAPSPSSCCSWPCPNHTLASGALVLPSRKFSCPSLAPSLCQLLIPAECPGAPPAPGRAGARCQESLWALPSCAPALTPARLSPDDPRAKAIVSLRVLPHTWRGGSTGREPRLGPSQALWPPRSSWGTGGARVPRWCHPAVPCALCPAVP